MVCYKVIWVIKDNHLGYAINYHGTYISVVKTMYFKIIFGKAAKKDLEIAQLDMVTAFLSSLIADGLLINIEQSTGYGTIEYLVYLL